MSLESSATNVKERSQRSDALFWAGVMIWAGLVFGAESLGILPQLGDADAWNWVFFGAGLYALLIVLYRTVSSEGRKPSVWAWVWGAALLIIGLSGLTTLEIGVPLILLLIGAALLGTALLRES